MDINRPNSWDVLKNIDEAIIILDTEFRIIWLNNRAFKSINIMRMPGEMPFCALFTKFLDYSNCPFIKMLQVGDKDKMFSRHEFQKMLNVRKGYRISVKSIPDDENHQGWFVTIKDEKRKKELENFVYQTHNRFQAVFEAYPHALLVIDENYKVIYCNGNGIDMLKLKPQAYFGASIFDIEKLKKIEELPGKIERVIDDKQGRSFFGCIDDIIIKIELFPLEAKSGNLDYYKEYCISIADITRERHLERRVKLLFKAIDGSKEGIAILNDDFDMIYSNASFIEYIGEPYDKDKGNFSLMDIFMQDNRFKNFWESLERSIVSNNSFSSEIVWDKNGNNGVFDLFLSRVVLPDHNFKGFVCSIKDISVQKVFESRLAESQKLESLGNLTRSFVHDFNNILSSINGSAELIRRKLKANDPKSTFKYIDIIERSIDSSSKMLMNLLQFTRAGFSEETELSVREIAKHAIDIVSPSMQDKVKFNLLMSKSLPKIMGDEIKLVEVFVNLFINANDAMPDGGEISILSSNFVVDDDNIWEFPEARKGLYLLIDVKDTGTGIPEYMQDRVFEPFFSTKDSKPVAGLGLSIVKEIMRKHNGLVMVESEMQKGTVFHLYFPYEE